MNASVRFCQGPPTSRIHCLMGALQFGLLFTSSPAENSIFSTLLTISCLTSLTAQSEVWQDSFLLRTRGCQSQSEKRIKMRSTSAACIIQHAITFKTVSTGWPARIRIRFSPVLSQPLPCEQTAVGEGLQSAFCFITSRQEVKETWTTWYQQPSGFHAAVFLPW